MFSLPSRAEIFVSFCPLEKATVRRLKVPPLANHRMKERRSSLACLTRPIVTVLKHPRMAMATCSHEKRHNNNV